MQGFDYMKSFSIGGNLPLKFEDILINNRLSLKVVCSRCYV